MNKTWKTILQIAVMSTSGTTSKKSYTAIYDNT